MGQARKTAGTSYPEVSSRFRLFPRVGHRVGQDRRRPNQYCTTPNRMMRKYPQYPEKYAKRKQHRNKAALFWATAKAQINTSRKSKETAQPCGFFVFGGGEWIRTTEVVDNRFTVCPLWPLGNSPIKYLVLYKACPASSSGRTAQFGAGGRTRTPDLLITNQLLYQLSYTSSSLSAFLLYSLFLKMSSLFLIFL